MELKYFQLSSTYTFKFCILNLIIYVVKYAFEIFFVMIDINIFDLNNKRY
jgi:hypothetical protein